jgi:hypothetical protein
VEIIAGSDSAGSGVGACTSIFKSLISAPRKLMNVYSSLEGGTSAPGLRPSVPNERTIYSKNREP